MADIKVTLELDNRQYVVEIDKSKQATKTFESSVAKSADGIKNSFGGIITRAQAVAATFLVMAQQTMAFADEMADLAKAHDTTAASVLAFGKALAQNGGKADSAGRAFLEFSKSIYEANNGNIKTLNLFEKMGISITDLAKLSEEQLRGKLIKSLGEITDPAERAAIAAQFFGKSMAGVDLKKLNDDIEKNKEKFAKYEPALQSAAEAYDNMANNITNLKIAFAQAFKPIFDLINYMGSSNIDAIATAIRAIGVALGVLVAAKIVNGLFAVAAGLKAIDAASTKNKFLAIALILAQVGSAVYDWKKGTEEATKEAEKATEESNNNRRSQEGTAEAIGKVRRQMEKVVESYKQANDLALKKLDLELETIGLSEDEKKIRTELNAIDAEAAQKRLDLKQQFDALDKDMQVRQAGAFQETLKNIDIERDRRKTATEEQIKNIERVKMSIKDTTEALKISSDSIAEAVRGMSKDSPTFGSARIEAENKLNSIIKQRNLILQETSKLSIEDQIKINQAVDEAIIKYRNFAGSVSDLNIEFITFISTQLRAAGTSNDVIRKIVDGLAAQRGAIRESTELIIDQQKQSYENSRKFATGWNKAFSEYVENATNAAQTAQRLFERATQGMEDAIVNFAKTGKFEFKNFVAMMAEELLRSQVRQLMANIMLGARAMGSGNIFGSVGKLLGFASGGVVPGGRPILVGERGPELFVPPGNGNIVPNNQLSSSGSVTLNINAVDAPSFQALVARDPRFIYAVAEMGRKTVPGMA